MKVKNFLGIAGIIFGSLLFNSCLDNDTYDGTLYPNALVTVKQNSDKSIFLQLDDTTTLLPTNIKTSPFGGREVRALINFKEVNELHDGYSKAVYINWIDSIRTKMMAPNLASKNDSVYGVDPVEIINDWITIAEDGYLTLRFRTKWDGSGKSHFVNLLESNNSENPYEIEFRHNAYGDTNGAINDALVAFKLDKLPDTEGKTVKLKLKWKSFSGDKSVEFNYTTHKAIPSKSVMAFSPTETNVE